MWALGGGQPGAGAHRGGAHVGTVDVFGHRAAGSSPTHPTELKASIRLTHLSQPMRGRINPRVYHS